MTIIMWCIYHPTSLAVVHIVYTLLCQLFRYCKLHQCVRILDENSKLVASIIYNINNITFKLAHQAIYQPKNVLIINVCYYCVNNV